MKKPSTIPIHENACVPKNGVMLCRTEVIEILKNRDVGILNALNMKTQIECQIMLERVPIFFTF